MRRSVIVVTFAVAMVTLSTQRVSAAAETSSTTPEPAAE